MARNNCCCLHALHSTIDKRLSMIQRKRTMTARIDVHAIARSLIWLSVRAFISARMHVTERVRTIYRGYGDSARIFS